MEDFKKFLDENGVKDNFLAKLLKITKQSISAKLNEKQPFKLKEIKTIKNHFKLTDRQVVKFFVDSVPD